MLHSSHAGPAVESHKVAPSRSYLDRIGFLQMVPAAANRAVRSFEGGHSSRTRLVKLVYPVAGDHLETSRRSALRPPALCAVALAPLRSWIGHSSFQVAHQTNWDFEAAELVRSDLA